jgi:hypothetical protein
MENDPSLEFEFWLADRLKCTVAELRRMSQAEFLGWSVYHGRRAQREEIARAKR